MNLKALNNQHFSLTAVFIVLSILLFSCAQIVPLTGGEKDIDAPKELESFPANGSVRFSSKSITVNFNEFIQLTNVSSQLIVSPLMETPPEVMVKGKKLIIKIEGELTPNTTYSLNFGNSITDITEGNVFPNYKYVFSTGEFIDSLSYSGTVLNAFNQNVKENVYVLFYDQFEDSIPLKELPRYIASSNKDGEFSINNIANGKYKIFAIKDINSNYLFDLPNEEIGFKNELITLDSSSTKNDISLFKEDNELQFIVKSEHKSYGKIDFEFNLPVKELSIKALNNKLENWCTIEKNEDGNAATLWLSPKIINKELKLLIQDKNDINDTLDFELITAAEFKDTILNIQSNTSSSFDLNTNVILTINHPLNYYFTDSIKLYEDSTLVTKTSFTNKRLRDFELDYKLKENTIYQLFIPPNTFKDNYGFKNDTVQLTFKTKKEAEYGTINLTINPNFSDNYIIQLSKNNKIINESYFTGNDSKKYNYLPAGNYSLKLIVDNNGDKKWTTGNYLKGLQPEKVIIYDKKINIRANWDNDVNWKINH